MSTAEHPLIPIHDLGGVLLISLQGDLTDGTAVRLQDDATTALRDTGAPGLVIDISAVEIVDSFLARVLAEIAACSRLMSARTVLAGMRPAVALTLVDLGLELPGLECARTVPAACARLGIGPPGAAPAGDPSPAGGPWTR